MLSATNVPPCFRTMNKTRDETRLDKAKTKTKQSQDKDRTRAWTTQHNTKTTQKKKTTTTTKSHKSHESRTLFIISTSEQGMVVNGLALLRFGLEIGLGLLL